MKGQNTEIGSGLAQSLREVVAAMETARDIGKSKQDTVSLAEEVWVWCESQSVSPGQSDRGA